MSTLLRCLGVGFVTGDPAIGRFLGEGGSAPLNAAPGRGRLINLMLSSQALELGADADVAEDVDELALASIVVLALQTAQVLLQRPDVILTARVH